MSRQNFCISLDPEDHRKITRDLKLSLSKVVQHAIDSILSEGFEDYVYVMKLRIIADDLKSAKEEMKMCLDRAAFLEIEIDSLQKMYDDNSEALNFARTVGKLSELTQKLNLLLIKNGFDISKVEKNNVVIEMKKINTEFDLVKHNENLMKIMGY